MSIFDQVSDQLKDAMRSQDKDRLNGLRGIRAAFIEAMKVDNSKSIADDKALDILRKLAKMRRESIDAYRAGGRTDLVEVEVRELAVVESFLPKAADDDTIRGWVREAISATGATSARDMGKVMGALMAAHKGEVDGKVATRLIKEILPS